MADQKTNELYEELKSKYNTLVVLGSDYDGEEMAIEMISGEPADITYMLGHALGTFCKGKGENNIKALFGIFQMGIHDAYEGGSHDQNNKD